MVDKMDLGGFQENTCVNEVLINNLDSFIKNNFNVEGGYSKVIDFLKNNIQKLIEFFKNIRMLFTVTIKLI